MITRCLFKLCKNSKCTSTVGNVKIRALSNTVRSASKECSEVEIKVPWGKVAGKLWGPKDVQPILAIHGWQDNAGTFDRLIPLLPSNTSVLAIDLPGHGLSSWLPNGSMYNEIVYLLLLQRLKKHFGWEKLKFLAHSLGAQVSFWHTSLFPEETEFVIALDALKFVAVDFKYYGKIFKKATENLFKIEDFTTPPIQYTEDQIIERWKATAISSIEDIVCKTLMVRGTSKTENGKYIWNRDPRLKILPIQTAFTQESLNSLAELITCPYLFIKAESSSFFEQKEKVLEIIETMKKNNKNVQYVTHPGSHHFHITHVEGIASIVNPFLEKYNV